MPGPHEGFIQAGPVPSAHWLLWDMHLFFAPAAGQQTATRGEVKPDRVAERGGVLTETWSLDGARDILIACVYNGSGTYYRARPHPPPSRCALHDDNGLTRAWCE